MCTERRTYELKLVETSNTLLLAPSLQTPKDPGECVWKGMGGCGEWMWVWCGECVMCEWVWCVGVWCVCGCGCGVGSVGVGVCVWGVHVCMCAHVSDLQSQKTLCVCVCVCNPLNELLYLLFYYK